MGIFDWLILLLIAFFTWRGWSKGFIGMLLHLAGIVLVFFLVAHYFPVVKTGLMLKLHLGVILSTILAVIMIVAMIALIVQIIKMLLEKTLKLMHISFLNSSMGALMGFLTGLLVMVVLSIFIDIVPFVSKPLQNSEKHRVYAAVKVVRSEMYSAFKIKERVTHKKEQVIEKVTPAPFKKSRKQ
jgi:uncharacterized membrane protein required for colicin V production